MASLRVTNVATGPNPADGSIPLPVGGSVPRDRSPSPSAPKCASARSPLMATAIANSDARAEIERLAGEQAALRRVATLVARGAETEEVLAAVARGC
jgi:hypothetical protein